MADGTPWKHDLSHDSTISLWVAGAVMNMARLPKRFGKISPIFYVFLQKSVSNGQLCLIM